MRILFIFNLAYKNPFFFELVHKLHESGHTVYIYDFVSSRKYDPATCEIAYLGPFLGSKLILKIKYLRRLFIPLINKMIIQQEFRKGDVVNIHFVHTNYPRYAIEIKRRVNRLITTFWGSDLLRADNKTLIEYIPLLELSDEISMVCGIQKRFIELYPQYKEKVKTTFFGISLLDIIQNIGKPTLIGFLNKHQINKHKNEFFITIGYNGSTAQQHFLLLKMIENLNENIKKNIFLLVPLTYGGTQKYKEEVTRKLNKLEIKHHVFTEYLTQEEMAALRVISDITLNIQVTDAFSASISESIVAGNIVLVGDWLPYEIFDQWGVKIYKASLNDFTQRIESTILHYEYFRKQIEGNSNKIYEHLNWHAAIKVWKELLQMRGGPVCLDSETEF